MTLACAQVSILKTILRGLHLRFCADRAEILYVEGIKQRRNVLCGNKWNKIKKKNKTNTSKELNKEEMLYVGISGTKLKKKTRMFLIGIE